MNEIFTLNRSLNSSRRPYNLMVPRINQSTFGLRSIQYEGPRIWNHLPDDIKMVQSYNSFMKMIKIRQGPHANVISANI